MTVLQNDRQLITMYVLALEHKIMLWIPVRQCDYKKYPQHMVLRRNKSFLHLNTNARFPPFYYMLGANVGYF